MIGSQILETIVSVSLDEGFMTPYNASMTPYHAIVPLSGGYGDIYCMVVVTHLLGYLGFLVGLSIWSSCSDFIYFIEI